MSSPTTTALGSPDDFDAWEFEQVVEPPTGTPPWPAPPIPPEPSQRYKLTTIDPRALAFIGEEIGYVRHRSNERRA